MLRFGLVALLIIKIASVQASNFYAIKNSKIKVVNENEIYVSEGKVSVKSDKDFKVSAQEVSFNGKNSEWVVTVSKSVVEAKVLKGEVTAISPNVNTFVPIVVKAGKSIKYFVVKKAFDQI